MSNQQQPGAAGGRGPRVLVTGGAGFLGHALVGELQRPPESNVLRPAAVRVFDLRRAGYGPRVEQVTGDLCSYRQVRRACEGIDVVIHSGALVDWGQSRPEVVEAVNVGGTRNVVEACLDAGVRALVHTSTLDVVYTGRPVIDGDERLPYPDPPANAYCGTKARAEQHVLRADGTRGRGAALRTAVIRPCSIYGERDPYHVSSVLRMARRKVLFRMGDGSAVCQHVYVGNVAHAHLLAARNLLEGGAAAGQAYFIADSPPQNFFDFLEPIVEGAGYRMHPWSRALPRRVMFTLGLAAEALARAVRPVYRFTPTLSRFAVDFVCEPFTFLDHKARRELGYAPVYDDELARQRTIAFFREHGPV